VALEDICYCCENLVSNDHILALPCCLLEIVHFSV
jgi:hypothetical protein